MTGTPQELIDTCQSTHQLINTCQPTTNHLEMIIQSDNSFKKKGIKKARIKMSGHQERKIYTQK